MKRIQVGLDDETLGRIDQARGMVAREAWLRALIKRGLDRSEEVRAADEFARNTGVAGGTKGATPTPRKQPVPKVTVIPESCTHPPGRREKHKQGTLCRACGAWL